MKLSQLAKKPQLIEITVNDEETIAEFGEALTFHTWDRQPMDVFLKLAAVDQNNTATVIEAVRDLVLNEDGTRVMTNDVSLPTKVMLKVIAAVVDNLGK